MAVELEGLQYEIEAKTNDSAKGVNKLIKNLEKLQRVVGNTSKIDKLSSSLERLSASFSKLDGSKVGSISNAFKSMNGVKISSTIARNLESIGAAISAIRTEDIEKAERLAEALKGIGSSGVRSIPSVSTPTTSTSSTVGIGSEMDEVTDSVDSANEATRRLNLSFFKIPFTLLSTGFKKVASGVKTFAINAAKLPMYIGSRLAAQVKKTTSSLGGFLNSLKRIALYRAVRFIISQFTQGLKEGIDNLYQYSRLMNGSFHGSMDKLASDALYLKNSLGAMVSPIITALAPAIDFVADKIVGLMNVVNQLFSRLTGRTSYTAAQKISTEYADAAKDVKKSVDKMKSYTFGFDELNILDRSNNGDSDSDSSNTPDYGSMFKEVPIESSVSDFADRLKEAFMSGDWDGLGKILGNKFNDIVAKVPWKTIGKTIGKGINGAIKTAYSFLDTSDFRKLGNDISDAINSMLSEIDFNTLGRLLVKRFTVLFDLLIGTIENLDFKLLAKSFSDGIIGIFQEATDWIQSYNWNDMGSMVYTKLKDFITGIDWLGLVNSVISFFGNALAGLVDFIIGFFGSLFKDILPESVYDALVSFGQKAWDVIKWGFDLVTGKVVVFGADVENDAPTWWDHIKEWFYEHVGSKFVTFKANVVNDVKTWWNNVKTWWKNLGGKIVEFTAKLVNDAAEWWNNLQDWWKIHVREKWVSFKAKLQNDAYEWWENTKKWWAEKVGNVKEFLTNPENRAHEWWSNVKEWWSNAMGLDGLLLKMKFPDWDIFNWWNGILRWWDNVSTLWLNIKLPHINIDWGSANVFGKVFNYPKGFWIDWYAKGGILDGSQIFGMGNGGNLLGGGEAGKEAVLPLESHTEWMDTIAQKVNDKVSSNEGDADTYSAVRRAMNDFYSERMEGRMNQIGDDARRQADKDENPIVNIDGREVSNTVEHYRRSDGYRMEGWA